MDEWVLSLGWERHGLVCSAVLKGRIGISILESISIFIGEFVEYQPHYVSSSNYRYSSVEFVEYPIITYPRVNIDIHQ